MRDYDVLLDLLLYALCGTESEALVVTQSLSVSLFVMEALPLNYGGSKSNRTEENLDRLEEDYLPASDVYEVVFGSVIMKVRHGAKRAWLFSHHALPVKQVEE